MHIHTVAGYQGERLYTIWYPPTGKLRGSILWVHGYAEHSGRYEAVIRYLSAQGWGNLVWDLRGHGRSTGRRGFITDMEEYLYDLTAVRTHWKGKFSEPTVLFGHSLGGLIVLRYRQKYPEIWSPAATIVSAPLIQLRLQVPAWKKTLGQIAARFFPTLSLPSGLEPKHLTHDEAEALAYAQDPLVFRVATAGWFAAIQRAQVELWKDLPKLTEGAYLFLLPKEDPVCDSEATQRFFHHLPAPKKQLISYEGSYHEPLHETFREKVYGDLLTFLSKL
ncbi:MAG: lysophospholipase [Bacteroidia bacterium]|nr:lysophospholipase [Bacteroidia bacterium]MCX7652947.1 lysophospholipase [Bacteroidia bacterium]MDW8416585.1 alpha/beta hydrolase [Bacteroidia bacterium]